MTHVSPVRRHTRTLSLFHTFSLTHTFTFSLFSHQTLACRLSVNRIRCSLSLCVLSSTFDVPTLRFVYTEDLIIVSRKHCHAFSVPKISDTPRWAGFVSVAERVKYLSMVIHLQGPPTSFVTPHIQNNDFKDFNAKDLKHRF